MMNLRICSSMPSQETPFSLSGEERDTTAPVPRPPLDNSHHETVGAPGQHEPQGSSNAELSPSAIVETTLSENAALFLHSNRAWGTVKALQSKLPELQMARQQEKFLKKAAEGCPCGHCHAPVTVPRNVIRGIERDLPAQVRYQLNGIRQTSDEVFTSHVLPELHNSQGEPPLIWSAIDAKLSTSKQEFHEKSVRNGYAPEYVELGDQLLTAYLEADYADYLALKVVSSLLERPELVPSLTSRLLELAELASEGVLEYPGLLELVATRTMASGESVQERITKHILSGQAHYAADFLHESLEEQIRGPNAKELNVGIGIMRLTLDAILTPEFGVDSEGYVERLAQHWQAWPLPLAVALEIYTKRRVAESKERIQTALQPFVKQGRLVQPESKGPPPAAAKSTKKSKRTRPAIAPSKKPARHHDPEDVATAAVTRQIDRFAYLVNATGTKGNVFRLDFCDGLDGLLKVKHVRKFLEGHREEPRLAESVLTIFQNIVENPYDPSHSKKWATGYSLIHDSQPRSLYRFSPRDFPGSEGGRIITGTRILYGLVKNSGALTLALYGIFTKQQLVKQVGTLPFRD